MVRMDDFMFERTKINVGSGVLLKHSSFMEFY